MFRFLGRLFNYGLRNLSCLLLSHNSINHRCSSVARTGLLLGRLIFWNIDFLGFTWLVLFLWFLFVSIRALLLRLSSWCRNHWSYLHFCLLYDDSLRTVYSVHSLRILLGLPFFSDLLSTLFFCFSGGLSLFFFQPFGLLS